MKRAFLCFAIGVLAVTSAFAQNFSLQGRVVDAGKVTEGLPAAAVALLVNDTAVVAGVASDADGYFSLECKKAGEYKLKVTYVGYETLTKKISIGKNRNLKLGALLLKRDERLLKEVEVNALAQELTIKADTFIYHANAFRVPEGSTIAALIKQLPGLAMDSEGNLTFQGKAVSSILVNGQPFIGDANTAMSNIVSDAVQDVAVYEKTDEEKEFAGVYDTEKATVVDLKIKKEYLSQWNVNTDLGGGTHSKYMAKAFASNYTDKRRTAVYAQVNNISEDLVADENGNWQNDSWGPAGLYTYRKAGAIMSWENGKKNTEAGHLKFGTEVEAGHTSGGTDEIAHNEYILSTGNHFSYRRSHSYGRNRNINFNSKVTYNIDTLNRVGVKLSYSYRDNRNSNAANLSTYSQAMDFYSPEKGLIGDEVSEELKALGINSNSSRLFATSRSNSFSIDTRYVHRFRKEGFSFDARVNYSFNDNRGYTDALTHYRYFNSGTPESVDRRYRVLPNNSSTLRAVFSLNGSFTKNLKFTVGYSYVFKNESEEYNIYRLDRYPYYSQPGLPLGVRPSTADSLAAVIDFENSLNSTRTEHMQRLEFAMSGIWDKFEIGGSAILLHYIQSLDYERAGKCYTPSRSYLQPLPLVRLKWKPVKNGEISLMYYGYHNRPSLLELLPISDTSDQMVERVNNPGLKIEWTNIFNLNCRWFNEKRGDSYNLYGNYVINSNKIVDIIETDPLTGKMRHTKDNVNGTYYFYAGFNTEQPLDKERHWTLTAGAHYTIGLAKNYVGAMGDKLGLSKVHTYIPRANMGLKWRGGMWSVNLIGKYSADIARYDSTPELDHEGHTIECSLQPQVDLPFGMKINTSFMFYGRRGYADDMMNHDQWLWNATVSQSFLKNKALTLQLEAVDILGLRTSERSNITPQMRYFFSQKVYYSYVMLHAIYRFNIGGKE